MDGGDGVMGGGDGGMSDNGGGLDGGGDKMGGLDEEGVGGRGHGGLLTSEQIEVSAFLGLLIRCYI